MLLFFCQSFKKQTVVGFVPSGVDGLITQALLTGDFHGAVELCLHDNRMADSIILAIAGGAELLEKTQRKYFTKTHSKITKVTQHWSLQDHQGDEHRDHDVSQCHGHVIR